MAQIIGRIYRIVSSECDGCYIGSTTQQLNMRLNMHKNDYRRYLTGKPIYITSFEVIKFADASIELIHEGVFDNKEDLRRLEGEIIRTTPNAINKNVAGRSKKQYKQDNIEAYRAYQNTNCRCATCGGTYMIKSRGRHLRTKKHQNAVSSSSSVIDSSEASTDLP